jgi:hypothetical protein
VLRLSSIASRTPSAIVALVAFLGAWSTLHAQQPDTPTLSEILQRLEANLNHFDTSVPSFFCDEHVLSKVESDQSNRDTVTDSIFRLKRTLNPDRTTTLVESRDITTVNGKPAISQNMDGPSLLRGAFEGGLDVVSANQTSCMHYELQRINSKLPGEPYSIRFSTALKPQNSASCLLQEKSTGRALVDPASMQITHLEIITPRHTIIPGNASMSPVIGKRTLTVDYAPVVLDGETFWLPSAITMHASSSAGFHVTVWSYQASYRNYHRLEVKSRIFPGSEAPAP